MTAKETTVKLPGTSRRVAVTSAGHMPDGINAVGNRLTGKVLSRKADLYGSAGAHFPGGKGGEALRFGYLRIAKASTVCATLNKRNVGTPFPPTATKSRVVQSLKSWLNTGSYLSQYGVNVAIKATADGQDFSFVTWLASEAMPDAAKTLLGIAAKADAKAKGGTVTPIVAAA